MFEAGKKGQEPHERKKAAERGPGKAGSVPFNPEVLKSEHQQSEHQYSCRLEQEGLSGL